MTSAEALVLVPAAILAVEVFVEGRNGTLTPRVGKLPRRMVVQPVLRNGRRSHRRLGRVTRRLSSLGTRSPG